MQKTPPAAKAPHLDQDDAVSGSLLRARAVILGERLDHRGLGPGGSALADPVPLAVLPPIRAFAFRWGAVVIFGANPAEEAALLEGLRPRITNPTHNPAEETALLHIGAARDGVDAEGVIQLSDARPNAWPWWRMPWRKARHWPSRKRASPKRWTAWNLP